MALRQLRVDDLDGSHHDVQPVTFAVNGTTYTLDLGPENRARVVDALQPFIEHAQTGRSARPRRERAANHSTQDTTAVRHWARSNGFEVGDRGRIPQNVRDAYAAAAQA